MRYDIIQKRLKILECSLSKEYKKCTYQLIKFKITNYSVRFNYLSNDIIISILCNYDINKTRKQKKSKNAIENKIRLI